MRLGLLICLLFSSLVSSFFFPIKFYVSDFEFSKSLFEFGMITLWNFFIGSIDASLSEASESEFSIFSGRRLNLWFELKFDILTSHRGE